MSRDLSVDDDRSREVRPTTGRDDHLVACVVRYDQVPDECTIYPLDATDDELMTCWVTAFEGSFVSLDDAR